jgi:hypothetical protein
MKVILTVVVMSLAMAACSTYEQPSQVMSSAKTGQPLSETDVSSRMPPLAQAEADHSDSARVVLSKNLSLARFKGLVVIAESVFAGSGLDDVGQLKAINYFDRVLVYDDLQKLLVDNNLQGNAFTPASSGDLLDIYENYRPFLLIYFQSKSLIHGVIVDDIVAIDPGNMETVFMSEVEDKSKSKPIADCVPAARAGSIPSTFCAGPDRNIRRKLLDSFARWVRENG